MRCKGRDGFWVVQLKLALVFRFLMSLCLSLSCMDVLIWVNCCVIQGLKGYKLSLVLKLGHGDISFIFVFNKLKIKPHQNYAFSLPGKTVVLIDLLSQGSWWADSTMKMGHRQKP